jgi:hypothetical protein
VNDDAVVRMQGGGQFAVAAVEVDDEAALHAARRGKEKVFNEDFEFAKDKVMMGAERRSMLLTEKEKEIVKNALDELIGTKAAILFNRKIGFFNFDSVVKIIPFENNSPS